MLHAPHDQRRSAAAPRPKVIVIAPIYNIDGNEAIDVMNRTAQNGPIAGVGRRENARASISIATT